MPLNESEVRELVLDKLLPDARTEWGRLRVWEQRRLGNQVKAWMPDGVDGEYRDTMRKARGPWLQFAAEVYGQAISVSGGANDATWRQGWLEAGMDARHPALIQDACENGLSYLLTTEADTGGVFMRHLKAQRTYHVMEDPWDDVPQYVLTQVRGTSRHKGSHVDDIHRVFTPDATYDIRGPLDRPTETLITEHTVPGNPVSIISAGYTDADGRHQSPVEIGRAAYLRLVDAGFMLLMVGRYGAFPQKWQSGGVLATDDQGNALIRPSVDSLLHNPDYETKFGAFQAADIDKAVGAVNEQFEQLAAILQIPPHYLLGKVVNLSSDALAASEAGFQRKVGRIRASMALGLNRALANAAAILGTDEPKYGPLAPVDWQDFATTSLASGADAAVKLVSAGADRVQAFRLVPTWSREDAMRAAGVSPVATEEQPAAGAPGGPQPPEGQQDPAAVPGPQNGAQQPEEEQDVDLAREAEKAKVLRDQFDALGVAVRTGVKPAWAATKVGLDGAEFTGAVPVTLRQSLEDAPPPPATEEASAEGEDPEGEDSTP